MILNVDSNLDIEQKKLHYANQPDRKTMMKRQARKEHSKAKRKRHKLEENDESDNANSDSDEYFSDNDLMEFDMSEKVRILLLLTYIVSIYSYFLLHLSY